MTRLIPPRAIAADPGPQDLSGGWRRRSAHAAMLVSLAHRGQSVAVVRRVVQLDPDGTGPEWMCVVVRLGTGIWYQHQYGGTATRQGEVEGYLVPVFSDDSLASLRRVFERDLKGTGTWGRALDPDHLESVKAAVEQVPFWPSDGPPSALQLDEGRLGELDEGWIPVQTPDGPGVLLWSNSD